MFSRAARPTAIATAMLAIAVLSGCYESADVSLTKSSHDRGQSQYKGKVDPLLAKVKEQGLQNKLDARFKESETDR